MAKHLKPPIKLKKMETLEVIEKGVTDLTEYTKSTEAIMLKINKKQNDLKKLKNEIIKEKKEKEKKFRTKQLQSILNIVNIENSINISKITRTRDYVNARMIYAYMCRRFTKCTFKEIGILIERNHATIIHLIRHYEGVYKTDSDFKILSDRCLSSYYSEKGIEQPKVKAIEDINDELLKCDHTKLLRVKNYLNKIIADGNK